MNKTKFLIVENDPNDAMLITRALRASPSYGASSICRNPSEARDYLRGAGMYSNRELYSLPQVVITDINMGEETGIELVEWIRKQTPPIGNLPVVILTGSATPLQFQEAKQLGEARIFRKPQKLEDLQSLLGAIAAELDQRG